MREREGRSPSQIDRVIVTPLASSASSSQCGYNSHMIYCCSSLLLLQPDSATGPTADTGTEPNSWSIQSEGHIQTVRDKCARKKRGGERKEIERKRHFTCCHMLRKWGPSVVQRMPSCLLNALTYLLNALTCLLNALTCQLNALTYLLNALTCLLNAIANFV